jgi:hypothetical protein
LQSERATRFAPVDGAQYFDGNLANFSGFADPLLGHGALVLQRIVAACFRGQGVQILLRAFDQ